MIESLSHWGLFYREDTKTFISKYFDGCIRKIKRMKKEYRPLTYEEIANA